MPPLGIRVEKVLGGRRLRMEDYAAGGLLRRVRRRSGKRRGKGEHGEAAKHGTLLSGGDPSGVPLYHDAPLVRQPLPPESGERVQNPWITSPAGVVAVLAGVASLFFLLERKTGWRLFHFFPPLIFIYLVPVALSNTGVLPTSSPAYDFMGTTLLPVFLAVMLLDVDLLATVRVMGRGVFVMLLGTLGVVVGAPAGFLLVRRGLDPEAWQGFGALAGSWIGGTGNMLAVAQMVGLDDSSVQYGYAVIADNAVYLVWLPLLLGSKQLAGRFHAFTRVGEDRLQRMESAARELTIDKGPVEMRHLLYLTCIGFAVAAGAAAASRVLPALPAGSESPFITAGTWKILLVTVFGISLSFTPASRIPGTRAFSMALVYLFVARMGAKADLSNIGGAGLWFVGGAFVWIFIHGAFLLAAARVFRVDVHTAAIASAANIGGAASAPIVAAHHRPSLVPVSILMAMLGYAIGNPAAFLAALLCRWVAGV
ncbi:MAG: hypothetical protein CME07_01920 [Gemmatimonadetes bacterium]|nr:hypothetical protein [Gemmatimonadota bacterium]